LEKYGYEYGWDERTQVYVDSWYAKNPAKTGTAAEKVGESSGRNRWGKNYETGGEKRGNERCPTAKTGEGTNGQEKKITIILEGNDQDA